MTGRNFVIFGQPRTGSTLLVKLMQSHPLVQCDGEVLNRNRWQQGWHPYLYYLARVFPEPYVLRKPAHCAKTVYGFKLLYPQIVAPRRLLYILNRLGWQMIHIQRRELFNLALSQKVTQLTRHYGQ